MPTSKTRTPIEPGCYYHIYNRGNNFQKVFFKKEDYTFFLRTFKKYLHGYCTVFAFALIPNHYHFLLRANPDISGLDFSKQFAKFILSYTNKVNFRERRDGSLFLSHFKRIKIEDERYLRRLVFYINFNPVKHKVAENMRSYPYSSYPLLISGKPTSLDRSEVLYWFGGMKEFIDFHDYLQNDEFLGPLALEED